MLALAAALFVVVPFLFWRQTWFGRPLSRSEIQEYLQDNARPRRIQHALSQIADRLARGDTTVTEWYPRILELARHPAPEIRLTAAWVMGQDNAFEAFHPALRDLLKDRELMVRRNAALSLVRFRDAAGRAELVDMLRPHTVRAPRSGTVEMRTAAGQEVGQGALLARIGEADVRAPMAGRVLAETARNGTQIAAGAPVLAIAPGEDEVWEALRALYLVGTREDLSDVERYTRKLEDMPGRIREQAGLTAQAIRTRAELASNR
jgi:HEAT repeat protein